MQKQRKQSKNRFPNLVLVLRCVNALKEYKKNVTKNVKYSTYKDSIIIMCIYPTPLF